MAIDISQIGKTDPKTGRVYTLDDWLTGAGDTINSAIQGTQAPASTTTAPDAARPYATTPGAAATAPPPPTPSTVAAGGSPRAPVSPSTIVPTKPASTPASDATTSGYQGISPDQIGAYADVFKKYRDAAMADGRARGGELFGDNTLGRLTDGRTTEVQDVLDRYKSGLAGYSAPELQAMRDQASNGINQQAQTNLRALRGVQGMSGIRGGLASAQQYQTLQDAAKQRANFEQQLFIRNADEQQNRLGQYNGALTGAQAEELARKKYNIGQGEKEKFGQLSTELGYGGLGAGDTALASQMIIGDAMARAGATPDGGGGLFGNLFGGGSGGSTIFNTDPGTYASQNPWAYLIPGYNIYAAGSNIFNPDHT